MSWGSEYLHTMSWRDGIEKYIIFMITDSQLVCVYITDPLMLVKVHFVILHN